MADHLAVRVSMHICHFTSDISSVHPEMALFHNFCVDLRRWLCDVLSYVSAQPLDLLELVKNCTFLNWTLAGAPISFVDGHYLAPVADADHEHQKLFVDYFVDDAIPSHPQATKAGELPFEHPACRGRLTQPIDGLYKANSVGLVNPFQRLCGTFFNPQRVGHA